MITLNEINENALSFAVFLFRIAGVILLWGILSIVPEQTKYWKTGLLTCMICIGIAAFGIYINDLMLYTPIIASFGLDVMLGCVFIMYLVKKAVALNPIKPTYKPFNHVLYSMGAAFVVALAFVPVIIIVKNQDKANRISEEGLRTYKEILVELKAQRSDIDSLKLFAIASGIEQIAARKERKQILTEQREILLGQQELTTLQEQFKREQKRVRKEKKAEDNFKKSTKSIPVKKAEPKKAESKGKGWFQGVFDKVRVMQVNNSSETNMVQK